MYQIMISKGTSSGCTRLCQVTNKSVSSHTYIIKPFFYQQFLPKWGVSNIIITTKLITVTKMYYTNNFKLNFGSYIQTYAQNNPMRYVYQITIVSFFLVHPKIFKDATILLIFTQNVLFPIKWMTTTNPNDVIYTIKCLTKYEIQLELLQFYDCCSQNIQTGENITGRSLDITRVDDNPEGQDLQVPQAN